MTHRHPTAGTPGLVVMLEAAGRTIADLEQHVTDLNALIAAERAQRRDLEAALAACRADLDTGDVAPPPAHTDNDGPYAADVDPAAPPPPG